jgi:UMF1 family MFS transporter
VGGAATRWLEKAALGRPEARAWALYDWANSAFWLTVITTVFPVYYLTLVGDELTGDDAQLRFAAATRNALIVIAVLAPLLGTLADVRAAKKRMLAIFAFGGALSVAGMYFLQPGDWRLGLILFGLANIGAAGSVVFYDALLPHVARKDELDRLSTSGFALGYVGSGLLLILNLLWIRKPEWFGLPHGEGLSTEEATLPYRLSFLSVAIWWSVFTLPLLRRVKEPPASAALEAGRSTLSAALRRLRDTLQELRRYRQAFRMLIAFLVYNDGIVTLIRMAVIYAAAKNLDQAWILGSILLLQFVGVPFSLLFGSLGTRFGAKRMVLVGIGVYSLISILAFGLDESWHFVALALLVGTVQGGTQGLSRSLFASMIPSHKSGEFFAFFAVGEKFAGVLGPALFALMIEVTGSAQNAILSIIAFFVLGGLLLVSVDVEEGRDVAREAEAAAA